MPPLPFLPPPAAPPPIGPPDDPGPPIETAAQMLARRRAARAHDVRCAELGAERLRLMSEGLAVPARPARDRWYAAWRAAADGVAADDRTAVVVALADAAEAFRALDRVAVAWWTEAQAWVGRAHAVHPGFRALVGIEPIDPFRRLLPDRVSRIAGWLADRDEVFGWAVVLAAAGSLARLVPAMRREHRPGLGPVDDALDLLQVFADGGRAADVSELLDCTHGTRWLDGFTAVVAGAVVPPPPGYPFRTDELPAEDGRRADAEYLLRLAGWGAASGGHAEEFRRRYLRPADPPPPAERGAAVPGPTDPPAIPHWIHDLFRQQQYRLLCALWERGDVPDGTLFAALRYTDPLTAADNLRKRVSDTNLGLAEKWAGIGERWEIGQRRRDGVLYYLLRRLTPGSTA